MYKHSRRYKYSVRLGRKVWDADSKCEEILSEPTEVFYSLRRMSEIAPLVHIWARKQDLVVLSIRREKA